MNFRDYRVVYSCYKEGYEWTDEDIIQACSCLDAIEKIMNRCADNYSTCDVISVEEVDYVIIKNGIERTLEWFGIDVNGNKK